MGTNKILEIRTFTHSPQTSSPHSKTSADIGIQVRDHLQKHPDYKISKMDSYVIDDIAYVTVVFTE